MFCGVFRLCLGVMFCSIFVNSHDVYKTISLNKVLPNDNRELYGEFTTLNSSSTLYVNFTDVNKDLSFIIFQVHSHLYNVSLYKDVNEKKYMEGTNVGLHSSIEEGLDSFYIQNSNLLDLKVFIAVFGYKDTDPIPGGCNMEFPTPIAPYLKLKLTDKTYVVIEATLPKPQYDIKCFQNQSLIRDYFYMVYLPENNYNADVYFDTIRNMTTPKNIRRIGREIPINRLNYWYMRRMLAAYPGTGAIFVVISELNAKTYSVYVPSSTYSCSPLEELDCYLIDDDLTMLMSASLVFIGLFMCYFGHWYFKTQILTIGFLSGFIVTYILLSIVFSISGPALVFASAVSGLCVGAIRLVFWWLYGIPAFVVVMSSADVGFLVASFVYYVTPGGYTFLTDGEIDFNFWFLFIVIMILITIVLLLISTMANIICCSVVGAYATIYPFDYYLGTNLKYIINNTIRRATVADFRIAHIFAPWQEKDILLVIIWMVLAVTGFIFQYYYNLGRPPFPPPPRSVRAVPEFPAVTSIIAYPASATRRRSSKRNPSTTDVDEKTPLLS